MFLLHFAPKNLLSRIVGRLVAIRWPGGLGSFFVNSFARYYKINLEEAELPISSYRSISDLFTRRLREGVRPLGEGAVLHPADSKISQAGVIEQGKLIQVKGLSYTAADLLDDAEKAQAYEGGLFITYYLCPTDYHRVHAPISGLIRSCHHIAGQLWPVNEWSTHRISNLFAINERLVVEIDSDYGPVIAVMVGATNVGKMTASFDSEVVTNQAHRASAKKNYEPPLAIQKGDELGIFHMGSTVVMLYPPSVRKQLADWSHLQGRVVQVRSTLL